MELKVLVDNNTYIDRYYYGEPGVSYYIEDGKDKILFDTGYYDVFMKNAEKMGIDLGEVNKIVFSHGHNDHTRGLKYFMKEFDLSGKEIIAHPDTFLSKEYTAEDDNGNIVKEDIGSEISEEEISLCARLNLSKEAVRVSENIIFLGEIPKLNSFEERKQVGEIVEGKNRRADYVLDDSALVYNNGSGLFIITGCSHSGICNIVEYAKKVSGVNEVIGIIGGFHLFDKGIRLSKTISYLKDSDVWVVFPAHCVSLDVKCEMKKALEDVMEVGVGLGISVDDKNLGLGVIY